MQHPFWFCQLFRSSLNPLSSCLRSHFSFRPPTRISPSIQSLFSITSATPHCPPRATMFSAPLRYLRDVVDVMRGEKAIRSLIQTGLQISSHRKDQNVRTGDVVLLIASFLWTASPHPNGKRRHHYPPPPVLPFSYVKRWYLSASQSPGRHPTTPPR